MNVADSFALWWGRDAGLEDDGSVPLWGNEVCLSAPFVQSVLSNPIPTDLRALKLLSDKGGSMAMDIYSWMSYRLYTARKPSLITWETLASQFGSRTKETWKFKQQFVAKLDVVKLVYRSARFSVQDEGLLIFPSLSHHNSFEERVKSEGAQEASDRRCDKGEESGCDVKEGPRVESLGGHNVDRLRDTEPPQRTQEDKGNDGFLWNSPADGLLANRGDEIGYRADADQVVHCDESPPTPSPSAGCARG